MAFDAARQEVVLFGPSAIQGGASETWAWKRGTWTQLHPAVSPPPRTSAGMAYDAATQSVVVFGGQSSIPGPDGGLAPMADTWIWNGLSWSPGPSSGPPAAVGPLLAYDASLSRVIMLEDVTPVNAGPTTSPSPQTWSWDGHQWMQLHPTVSPSGPRFGGSMVFDENARVLVLYGQIIAGVGPSVGRVDLSTWTFDGTSWHEHALTGPTTSVPQALSFAAMAYDANDRTSVYFGGTDVLQSFADTWAWDGNQWKQRRPTNSPWARGQATAAYDTADRDIVLYGGEIQTQNAGTRFYDTWTWDGSTWSLQQPSASAASADQLRAMIAAAGAHMAGHEGSTGTLGIDAGYLSYKSQSAQGSGGLCVVYLGRDFPATWRYVDSACAGNFGVLPVVGQPDQVKVSGCANVRDAPDFGNVLACLSNGSQVTIDDGPFYVNGKLWWHLKGRGFMAHDLLIPGS